jgi:PAS domain S-box-containing protein
MFPARLFAHLRRFPLQPQRAIGVLALCIALVLCGLVANDLRRDYAQQLNAASAKTSSLTQLLKEHASQSMRRVELALSLVAQEVQTQYELKGVVDVQTGTSLRQFLLQDGLIASFAVLDANGRVLASTLTERREALPQAGDRDYFLAHQNPLQNGMYVGAAIKSRISGLWIIPISLRLQGGFNGYLLAAVDPAYFQNVYQSIDTGTNGFVSLYTTQGWAVARWPFSSEIAERNWLTTPLFTDQLPQQPDAGAGEMDAADGTPNLYSYHSLPDYPLVVALGVSKEETLAPWRQRALYESLGLLLMLLFLGGATVMLVKQLRSRQRAEAALQLSEISLRKSSLPTLWVGPDGRILRVNQAACDLHAYPEERMLAMTVADLNPGMSMDRWPAHWERLRLERNMRFETVHRNSLGEDMPVEVELNLIEFEGREFNFAFMRDLRLRKQAETELQRSAALLRSAIDAVDEAFVLFDTDDRMVYCNAKYINLYPGMEDVVVPGARFEDMIRVGAQRGLYRESIGREEAWIAERLRAHREGIETRVQKRDDGRVLRVIDRKTPEGNIAGIRVDITDVVRATEDAQEASRFKSQFLANMSHEIRTPMNAILGLLTLMQNTALNPVQRDYASKTEGAAHSLLHLLNDILDFSKVEAGKMELDPQPFRLDRMLRDVGVILSSSMAGKGIELLFDIDASLPPVVVADVMRLQQVLVNLGSNAIKFTTQGQVVLRLRNRSAEQGAVAGAPPQQTLIEFAIQDSGIGIAQDKQDHIFTGFSQAEASTTRRFGGTGLGLAICKRLVELMGGQLALQSTPGLGSTFSFVLPLALAPETPPAEAPQPRLSVAPKHVLIVDDNPVARDILASITASWGWPTAQASDGKQALALLRERLAAGGQPFEVIYLDWQMPDMDGWETARQIRALGAGQPLRPRIVMLSSVGRDSLLLRTAEEQALIDSFLFKPVTASALLDAALGQASRDAFAPHAQRSSNRPLAGMRILVVEDNLINQQVAEELLNAEGALVALAANGQLGVDAVAASQPPFDAVLMDIQMPVLDGFGATRKIRDNLGLLTLPIVAMTANAMDSDRQACLEAGMHAHVGKPFDMAHLVEVLLRVTGRAQAVTAGQPLAVLDEAITEPVVVQSGVAVFSSPYLDLAAALERISGLHALYGDIAREFVLALDAVEGDFHSAVRQQHMSALVGQMHTLKGTAATLGAERLSKAAAALETLFRRAEPGLVPLDHLPALLALVQQTRAATLQAISVLEAESGPQEAVLPLGAAPGNRPARDLLVELSGYLRDSNLAVLDRFEQRGDALDAVAPESVEALRVALRSLNLVLARQLCEEQIAAFDRL